MGEKLQDTHEADALTRAKARFSQNMLANSAFYALIYRRVGAKRHPFRPLKPEEIHYEPTYQPLDERSVHVGIRLSGRKMLGAQEAPEQQMAMNLYERISIATVDLLDRTARLDPSIVDEVEKAAASQVPNLSKEELRVRARQDASDIYRSWQNSWDQLFNEAGDMIELDPYTHTVTLRSDLATGLQGSSGVDPVS